MSYTIEHTLPTYKEVFDKLPLSEELAKQIEKHRREIKDILTGKSSRKLLVVGPCSAWPDTSVIDYAKKLAPLAKDLEDVLKIVMRVYIQKPRTTVGWMGPLVQPDPFTDPHIPNGILYCRKMMLDVLKMGLPIADELLFPRCESYFRDLLAWSAIGARSSENQEHRVLASLLDFPIGVKNPTSGNINIGVNSVLACQSSNYLAIDGDQVKTSGNPYAHVVLRGGNGKPNISLNDLENAAKILTDKKIQNPSIVIDVSHDNTCDKDGKKQFNRQIDILYETLDIMKTNMSLEKMIKGWMLESFIISGNQNLTDKNIIYGKSVTDGCLGWEETKTTLQELAKNLRKTISSHNQ